MKQPKNKITIITKYIKIWLFKNQFYTINYKLNSKIFKLITIDI